LDGVDDRRANAMLGLAQRRVVQKLDASFVPDPRALDHHESEWYLSHLT
jgi:hypothetical protein